MRLSRAELARELLEEAKKRRYKGLAVYGDFDPLTDKRTLAQEGLEEIIDSYNYTHFMRQKYPHLKEEILNAQRRILRCYEDFKMLLNLEQAETLKRGGVA